ncbi:DNA-directed RNA polymerase III subunit 2-like [Papaver somniferum]|uniref:DNA-directed RNA polymerase III subunit 2-like n=1 Tax=Papaver somniferum TaxID=3469 RepID=UPI000E6F858E|nr:DNA-directed RNA polymerase III subunit 2-like [Papaver somniferum]
MDGVRTFNNFLHEGLIEYLDVNEQNNALMFDGGRTVEVDQAVVGAAVVVSMMLIEVLMLILKMLMEVDVFAAMVLQMLWEVEMDQMAVAAAVSMAFKTQKVRHFRSRV